MYIYTHYIPKSICSAIQMIRMWRPHHLAWPQVCTIEHADCVDITFVNGLGGSQELGVIPAWNCRRRPHLCKQIQPWNVLAPEYSTVNRQLYHKTMEWSLHLIQEVAGHVNGRRGVSAC